MNSIDWNKLQAPTPKDEIKYRPLAGKQIKYVDARFVMDRLDTVIGTKNWWFTWDLVTLPTGNHPGCVRGHLSIKYEDSSIITKSDVGEYEVSRMSAIKGGVSDALKRCAVHFGIARDLYHEEVDSNIITIEDFRKTVKEVFPGATETTETLTPISEQPSTRATSAQIKYLTNLSLRFKFEVPENISKKEASELIQHYVDKTKNSFKDDYKPYEPPNSENTSEQPDIPF